MTADIQLKPRSADAAPIDRETDWIDDIGRMKRLSPRELSRIEQKRGSITRRVWRHSDTGIHWFRYEPATGLLRIQMRGETDEELGSDKEAAGQGPLFALCGVTHEEFLRVMTAVSPPSALHYLAANHRDIELISCKEELSELRADLRAKHGVTRRARGKQRSGLWNAYSDAFDAVWSLAFDRHYRRARLDASPTVTAVRRGRSALRAFSSSARTNERLPADALPVQRRVAPTPARRPAVAGGDQQLLSKWRHPRSSDGWAYRRRFKR